MLSTILSRTPFPSGASDFASRSGAVACGADGRETVRGTKVGVGLFARGLIGVGPFVAGAALVTVAGACGGNLLILERKGWDGSAGFTAGVCTGPTIGNEFDLAPGSKGFAWPGGRVSSCGIGAETLAGSAGVGIGSGAVTTDLSYIFSAWLLDF